MKPMYKGLTPEEIISAAIEAGFLPNNGINIGDEVAIPLWLAKILSECEFVEIVGADGQ